MNIQEITKQNILFVENEADTNELFAEIQIEDNVNIVLLMDNKTKEVKETHILKQWIDKEDSSIVETEDITHTYKGSFQIHKLVKLVFDNEIVEDFNRNYYHY
jgi:hypothetical protein